MGGANSKLPRYNIGFAFHCSGYDGANCRPEKTALLMGVPKTDIAPNKPNELRLCEVMRTTISGIAEFIKERLVACGLDEDSVIVHDKLLQFQPPSWRMLPPNVPRLPFDVPSLPGKELTCILEFKPLGANPNVVDIIKNSISSLRLVGDAETCRKTAESWQARTRTTIDTEIKQKLAEFSGTTSISPPLPLFSVRDKDAAKRRLHLANHSSAAEADHAKTDRDEAGAISPSATAS